MHECVLEQPVPTAMFHAHAHTQIHIYTRGNRWHIDDFYTEHSAETFFQFDWLAGCLTDWLFTAYLYTYIHFALWMAYMTKFPLTEIDMQFSSWLFGNLTMNFEPAFSSLSLRGRKRHTTLMLSSAAISRSADIMMIQMSSFVAASVYSVCWLAFVACCLGRLLCFSLSGRHKFMSIFDTLLVCRFVVFIFTKHERMEITREKRWAVWTMFVVYVLHWQNEWIDVDDRIGTTNTREKQKNNYNRDL